jgi:4-amino-4-deoxy-L-arabinose transferase-like glycosyltransferase
MREPALEHCTQSAMTRREKTLALLALAAFCAVLAALALGRTYFDYGTETDYVGSFVPEAERVLASLPLTLEWHPPLYPLLLAPAQMAMGNWLVTGVAISYVSAIAAIVCSFLFFRRIAGRGAGWGALLGLAGSGVFIEYAASASSDMLFLALFLASYLLALLAIEIRHPLLWLVAGLLAGLALLARSNAITLVLLGAAPLLCQAPARQKAGFLLLSLLGLALPALAWAFFAAESGAPFMPSGNHVNLAMTYFAEGADRVSYYARLQVLGRFESVQDVLLHDPARIARIYLADLVRLLHAGLPMLLEAPLNLLFAPGLVFLLLRRWNRVVAFFLAVTLAQVLLVNMKAFEPRLYLFLVPFFGASIAEIFIWLLRAAPQGSGRHAVLALLILGAAGAVGTALARAHGKLERGRDELADAVPKAQRLLDGDAAMLARKPHLPFYAGARQIHFPDVGSLRELRAAVAAETAKGPLYLFFGSQERSSWPWLEALATPARAPGWLQPIAISERPGAWALYRYAGEASD